MSVIAAGIATGCLGTAAPDQRCDPGLARLKTLEHEPVLSARPPGAIFESREVADPPDGFHNCQGPSVTVEFSSGDLPGTMAAVQAAAPASGWTDATPLSDQSGTLVRYEKQFGGWPGQLFIATDDAKHHVFVSIKGEPVVPTA